MRAGLLDSQLFFWMPAAGVGLEEAWDEVLGAQQEHHLKEFFGSGQKLVHCVSHGEHQPTSWLRL